MLSGLIRFYEARNTIFTLNVRLLLILTILILKYEQAHLLPICMKTCQRVANSVDTDQMLHSVVSDLGLHCLPSSISPKPLDKYGAACSMRAVTGQP